MVAVFAAVVAFALAGADASASSGATRASSVRPPAARARVVVPAVAPRPPVRARVTTLDAARASVPIPRSSDAPPVTARPSRSSSAGRSRLTGDAVWAALARCESSGNPTARSRDGRYSGAFQFSDATWRSLGFAGRAADHPYEVQLVAAKRLQARSGWGQWPRCARRLGLR